MKLLIKEDIYPKKYNYFLSPYSSEPDGTFTIFRIYGGYSFIFDGETYENAKNRTVDDSDVAFRNALYYICPQDPGSIYVEVVN